MSASAARWHRCTVPSRRSTDCSCWQVQAISLDFLGVPGSATSNATAELVAEHGFPSDKRLGAGIIDGRSVWADGGAAQDLADALLAQAPCCPLCTCLRSRQSWLGSHTISSWCTAKHCTPACMQPSAWCRPPVPAWDS